MEIFRWFVLIAFIIRQGSGRVCDTKVTTRKCSDTYYKRCGIFGWRRCSRTRYRICSSFQPICCPGYSGVGCTDVNECFLRTDNCQQVCVDTKESYRCACTRGYFLSANRRSCIDINECRINNGGCAKICTNQAGSYSCSCPSGFRLGLDRRSCIDINECLRRPCQQRCTNLNGSYRCSCFPGFQLMSNRRSCRDINECILNTDNCEQKCTNTIGSFLCSCRPGYRRIGNRCGDIDECASSPCSNGGICKDGENSFTCVCPSGTTGTKCQNDIDECLMFNGGCEENCENDVGTFRCGCNGNRTLNNDGKTCSGGNNPGDVFRRNRLARRLLPRGCATFYLTQCTDGNTIEVYLSSTSPWYSLNTAQGIYFTAGIVFVEVTDLALPISLNGVTVTQGASSFQIVLGTNGRTASDGTLIPVTRTDDCLLLPFTASDITAFVASVSFLRSYLDSLLVALPPWLGFGTTPFSVLDVSDVQTGLVYGRDMDDETWCEGAPVIPSHLYSVFKFTSAFSLSLYGNTINIPKPLNGRKFCLIVDICHNFGGTVFLMLPEESRNLLLDFDFFKELAETQDLTIQPRGIGLSVVKEVNVNYLATEIEFWNGDAFFKYQVFRRANLWIGGEVIKKTKALSIEGSADLFVGIPNPARMLTAIFLDEWNVLTRMRASATPTLHLKVFGKEYSISFPDLAKSTVDAYLSIGGMIVREWCGANANPPGIFLSTQVTINPFSTIPILKNWIISSSRLYAFVTSDPASQITDDMSIDILDDIVQVDEILGRLKDYVDGTVSSFGETVKNATDEVITKFRNALDSLEDLSKDLLNKIRAGGIMKVIDCLIEIWKDFKTLEETVTEFLDETEFLLDETKDTFIAFVTNELSIIKQNLNDALSNIRSQLLNAVKDYSGFGLKFSTTLDIAGLKILGVDIELVYSVENLFQCSRFLQIKNLFKGEKAVRFLGSISKEKKLGFFLKIDKGVGIGAALAINTNKFIVRLKVEAKVLGIRAEANLRISREGLSLSIEGNVWDLFLARLEISAETGQNWYQLTFTIKGQFIALGSGRKRRQVQPSQNSFSGSYLGALKNAITRISNDVQRRISQAQAFLDTTKSRLSQAQRWFDRKIEDVNNANRLFDNAIQRLETAKERLERAKGPFERALQNLNAAQRKVDNICRIKTCSSICIPALRPGICFKRVWGLRVPYPCIRRVGCFTRIPNPVCVAANTLCRGVRALAFAALEAAKLAVKAPMLALDLAKAAVSAAQFAVDKSRVVLDAAKAVLSLAKRSLDAIKLTLEIAKRGLELVKKAVGVGARILELVIEFGVGSIINVRNCGFRVVLRTTDLPVFDVTCEVNAFRLGWRTVGIRVNFRNIRQSLWQAARATINALKQGLADAITGRRKREVDYASSTYIHALLRQIRQAESGNTNSTEDVLDRLINVTLDTSGFGNGATTDDANRILLSQEKCDRYRSSSFYLVEIFQPLFDITSDIITQFGSINNLNTDLENYTINGLENFVELETAEVDTDFLMNTYGLTMEEIEGSVAEAKANFQNDELITQLSEVADFSRQTSQSNIDSLTSGQLLAAWEEAAENRTKEIFDESECIDFSDCILTAINYLYEIHFNETYPNIGNSERSISMIESKYLEILNAGDDTPIKDIFAISETILAELNNLDTLIPFCKDPPRLIGQPENVTSLIGRTVVFDCLAESSDTSLRYYWYKNGELVPGQSSERLTLLKVIEDDEGYYECIVGNVVANVTSERAWLSVTDTIDGCSNKSREVHDQPSKYEELVNGEWILRDCAFGSKYNSKVCTCSFIDTDCSNTYQPIEGEPNKYVVIANGIRYNMDCGPKTFFNPVTCICDYGATTTSPTIPTNDDCPLYSLVDDPSKYVENVNGQLLTRSCPEGTVFDADSCTCDHASLSTIESTTQPTTELTTTATSTCVNYLPVAGEPSKFNQSDNGQWIVMDCAPGTVFDVAICNCNFPPPK